MVFSNGIRIVVTIPNFCWVVWSRTIKSSTIIYQYPQTYPQVFRRFSQYINDIFHQPCQGCLSQPLLIAASLVLALAVKGVKTLRKLSSSDQRGFDRWIYWELSSGCDRHPWRWWKISLIYWEKNMNTFFCDMFVDITDKWCLVDDWGILLTEVFPTVSPAQWCPMYGWRSWGQLVTFSRIGGILILHGLLIRGVLLQIVIIQYWNGTLPIKQTFGVYSSRVDTTCETLGYIPSGKLTFCFGKSPCY